MKEREKQRESKKILLFFKRLKGNSFRRNRGGEMQDDPAFSQPPSLPALPALPALAAKWIPYA